VIRPTSEDEPWLPTSPHGSFAQAFRVGNRQTGRAITVTAQPDEQAPPRYWAGLPVTGSGAR
jgi:hypothetical protein